MSVEMFERAAEAGARLLKVDLSRGEPAGSAGVTALLLTFDVGRVLVRPDPSREEVSIDFIDAGAPLPGGLEDGKEDEPWWRMLGSPLARVWTPEGELSGGICLQFRADDQSPRIVTLEARGASLSVRLENPPE